MISLEKFCRMVHDAEPASGFLDFVLLLVPVCFRQLFQLTIE